MGRWLDNLRIPDLDAYKLSDRNSLFPDLLYDDIDPINRFAIEQFVDDVTEDLEEAIQEAAMAEPTPEQVAQMQIDSAITPGCRELLDSFDLDAPDVPQDVMFVCFSAEKQ